MENENKVIECFVDVQIKDEVKRLTIRHNEQVFDAEILVDNEVVTVKRRIMTGGAAFTFECDEEQIIVTILANENGYDYDCFINGISIQNDMPWQIGKFTVPQVMKWRANVRLGMTRYILTETFKGAFIGAALFIVLFIIAKINPDFLNLKLGLLHLALFCVPLAALYAALSPYEFNTAKKAVDIFEKYQNGETEEEIVETVDAVGETIVETAEQSEQ